MTAKLMLSALVVPISCLAAATAAVAAGGKWWRKVRRSDR